MAQMNLSKNRNRFTDMKRRFVVTKGEGAGWAGNNLGLVDANITFRMDKQ